LDGHGDLHDFVLSQPSCSHTILLLEAVGNGAIIDLNVFVFGPDGTLPASSAMVEQMRKWALNALTVEPGKSMFMDGKLQVPVPIAFRTCGMLSRMQPNMTAPHMLIVDESPALSV
jgi:hypothetical protein